MKLYIRPCTVKRARAFIGHTHRRLPKLQGAMWAIRVVLPFAPLSAAEDVPPIDGDRTVGVAAVGHPARMLAEQGILCVLRVAVQEGRSNACSMLYGACSRAAKAMGATDLVTYTHLDEPGTSLLAANWVDGGITKGGEWSRPSRPRQAAMFPESKRRWWAPWGANAKVQSSGRA